MAPKTPKDDDKIPVLTLPNRGEDEPGAEPEPSPEMDALKATVATLEASVADGKEREDRLARMQEQFLMRPAAPASVAPVAPAPPAVTFENMPDPSLEPEKFATEMATRTTALATQAADAAAAARIAPAASAMDVQQKVADLRTRFASSFPDLANYGDLVEAEIAKRAREAGARGMDVETMVFGNPDLFVKDVGAAVTARLDGIRKPEEKPGEEEEEGHRDVDLAGGGGSATPAAKSAANTPPDFMQQLAKAQRDSGFF